MTWLWLRRVAFAIAGIVTALACAEGFFYWRDEGAFPHINLYVADPELGTKLRPSSSQYFKFRDNPRSQVHINAQGFRGEAWPTGTKNEILVVGDSQAFGLGVDDEQTFSAQLGKLSQRTVLNAGTPTYGPVEFNKLVERILKQRNVGTVIYTVNLANDLFEYDRPNTKRHAVWDGWAVRVETAPKQVSHLPGRDWLFRRSHLVFALRQWLYTRHPHKKPAFASEGAWQDLSREAVKTYQKAKRETATLHAQRETQNKQIEAARKQLEEKESALESALLNHSLYPHADETEKGDEKSAAYQAAVESPGDIVTVDYGEDSRPIAVTSSLIRKGAALRNQLEQALIHKQRSAAQLIRERDKLDELVVSLEERLNLAPPRIPSVLEARLAQTQKLCSAAGAELVVLILPLDVQVTSTAFAKYGAKAIDMSPTRVLIKDLVGSAHHLGLRSVDMSEALAKAPQTPFLKQEFHLNPRGHRLTAEALHKVLSAPPPPRPPASGLPAGRSLVPTPQVWHRTPEITVKGSSRAGCETVRIREWLRVACFRKIGLTPAGVSLAAGYASETLAVATDEATTLVVALLPKESWSMRFDWVEGSRLLHARWNESDQKHLLTFEDTSAPQGIKLAPTPAAMKLCACYNQIENEKSCKTGGELWDDPECKPSCEHLYGEPTQACLQTYASDCEGLVRCARGEPAAPPTCFEGYAVAAGTRQCFKLCDAKNPCKSGTCSPWQGTNICK